MEEVAKSGQMQVPLMERIMNFNPELALTWMCDLEHPIVVVDPEADLRGRHAFVIPPT